MTSKNPLASYLYAKLKIKEIITKTTSLSVQNLKCEDDADNKAKWNICCDV